MYTEHIVMGMRCPERIRARPNSQCDQISARLKQYDPIRKRNIHPASWKLISAK